VNGYSRAYAASKFNGMSPERLVLAMFDGALRSIDQARVAIDESDVAMKCESIGKALAIVAELQTALNPQAGELTEHLEALYDYVLRKLTQGNMESDPTQLAEARSLLLVLRDGWAQLLDGLQDPVAAPTGTEAPTRSPSNAVKGYL